MLIRFKVENFLSLKSEQTLDFVKHSHGSEGDDGPKHGVPFVEHELEILPVLGVFGPNASGKTNALSALAYLDYVITYGTLEEKLLSGKGYQHAPFLMDRDSINRPSRFFIAVGIDKDIYEYSLDIQNNTVIHESLSIVTRDQLEHVVFSRASSSQDVEWNWGDGSQPSRLQLNKSIRSASRKLKGSKLFLSYIAESFDIDFISKFVAGVIGGSSTLLCHNDLADLGEHLSLDLVKKGGRSKAAVLKFLELFGGNFADLVVKDGTLHAVYQTKEEQSVELNFKFESQGFRRLFCLCYSIIRTLESGSFILIDELDSHLHHLIIHKLLSLFHDKEINSKGAQLIFTSHDLNLVDQNLFRREQIYFAEKMPEGNTELYSILDIKDVKQRDKFLKLYLSGRFHALPVLQSDDLFLEEAQALLSSFTSERNKDG